MFDFFVQGQGCYGNISETTEGMLTKPLTLIVRALYSHVDHGETSMSFKMTLRGGAAESRLLPL